MVVCRICKQTFQNAKSLYSHLKENHKFNSPVGGRFKCPLCKTENTKYRGYRDHLLYEHGQRSEGQKFTFQSLQDFYKWKAKLEDIFERTYVLVSGPITLASSDEKYVYQCSPRTRSEECEQQDSESKCRSMISATHFSKTQKVEVEYWQTHTGHTLSLKHTAKRTSKTDEKAKDQKKTKKSETPSKKEAAPQDSRGTKNSMVSILIAPKDAKAKDVVMLPSRCENITFLIESPTANPQAKLDQHSAINSLRQIEKSSVVDKPKEDGKKRKLAPNKPVNESSSNKMRISRVPTTNKMVTASSQSNSFRDLTSLVTSLKEPQLSIGVNTTSSNIVTTSGSSVTRSITNVSTSNPLMSIPMVNGQLPAPVILVNSVPGSQNLIATSVPRAPMFLNALGAPGAIVLGGSQLAIVPTGVNPTTTTGTSPMPILKPLTAKAPASHGVLPVGSTQLTLVPTGTNPKTTAPVPMSKPSTARPSARKSISTSNRALKSIPKASARKSFSARSSLKVSTAPPTPARLLTSSPYRRIAPNRFPAARLPSPILPITKPFVTNITSTRNVYTTATVATTTTSFLCNVATDPKKAVTNTVDTISSIPCATITVPGLPENLSPSRGTLLYQEDGNVYLLEPVDDQVHTRKEQVDVPQVLNMDSDPVMLMEDISRPLSPKSTDTRKNTVRELEVLTKLNNFQLQIKYMKCQEEIKQLKLELAKAKSSSAKETATLEDTENRVKVEGKNLQENSHVVHLDENCDIKLKGPGNKNENLLRKVETCLGQEKNSDVYTMIRTSVLHDLYAKVDELNEENLRLLSELQKCKMQNTEEVSDTKAEVS